MALKTALILPNGHGASRDGYRHTLLSVGLQCDPDGVVSYNDLTSHLHRDAPDLRVVVSNGNLEKCLETIRLASSGDTPVLVIGPTDNPSMIIKSMRNGAVGYLDERNLVPELASALNELSTQRPKFKRGKVLVVFSPAGGGGATTVATNMAASLGRRHADEVVLIDLKPERGDVALLLDLQPQGTVADIYENIDRLDATLLKSCLVRHEAGIHVLGHSPARAQRIPFTATSTLQLLTLARGLFKYTVLDADHATDEGQREALRLADFVVMVIQLNVPAVAKARWALDLAREIGISTERIRLVVNRYGRGDQLSPRQAEEMLGMEIFQYLPDDARTTNRAVTRGQPICSVGRWSKIARRFNELAHSMNGGGGKLSPESNSRS
jgi:pilus assembly protein CpaE